MPPSELLLPLADLFLITSSQAAHEAREARLLWREGQSEWVKQSFGDHFHYFQQFVRLEMPFSNLTDIGVPSSYIIST